MVGCLLVDLSYSCTVLQEIPSPLAPGFFFLPTGSSGGQQAAPLEIMGGFPGPHISLQWEETWGTLASADTSYKYRTSHEMLNSSAVQGLLFLRLGVLPKGSLLSVTLILKLVIFWLTWSAFINSSQAICFGFGDFYLCLSMAFRGV